jgi:hypothetical protein
MGVVVGVARTPCAIPELLPRLLSQHPAVHAVEPLALKVGSNVLVLGYWLLLGLLLLHNGPD